MADVSEGPALLVKKLGGLVLVFLGMLGLAFGYENGSGSLRWRLLSLSPSARASLRSKLFAATPIESRRIAGT
jgi:hypothetical protein